MLVKIREWGAFIGLAFFLGAGLVYSLLNDPTSAAKKLRTANVAACQRALSKSLVIEDFMNQAAEARRNGAAADTDPIAAANDLAAAEKYEADGVKLTKLTVTDCPAAYPEP